MGAAESTQVRDGFASLGFRIRNTFLRCNFGIQLILKQTKLFRDVGWI
jgi:hypothetical protein